MGYDYEILYKKDSKNKAADALSRIYTSAQLLTLTLYTLSGNYVQLIMESCKVDTELQKLAKDLKESITNLEGRKASCGLQGLHSSNGKTIIFMVMDRLNKYAYFVPLSHTFTDAQIGQVFLDNVYKLYGLPKKGKVSVSLMGVTMVRKLSKVVFESAASHMFFRLKMVKMVTMDDATWNVQSNDIAQNFSKTFPLGCIDASIWLPTRPNLAKRGVNIPCFLCPNCGTDIESALILNPETIYFLAARWR
ncbi:retrotransposable element Tf2 [Tanacetum coccineum]